MSAARVWLRPAWPAPATVLAAVSTRSGGVSADPWHSFNLGLHVGDDPLAVAENRRRLQADLGLVQPVQWLQQMHGTDCVVIDCYRAEPPMADAAYTRLPGQALAVMTADCLPLFVCDRAGREVAVVHAGWRGLAAGVIESTLQRFCAPASDCLAWLGPAIGSAAFQVGAEVRAAFLAAAQPADRAATAAAFRLHAAGGYHADLYALARLRLAACGVSAVSGGGCCTVTEARRFFSYRRDGRTGRMASVIALGQGA